MRLLVVALIGLGACARPTVAQPPVSSHATPIPAQARSSPGRCANGRYDARSAQSRAGIGFMGDHVHGDLDKSLIRREIYERSAELRACYSTYLEHGSQAGRVNAQFTVIGDGSVGDAWVTGFDDALADCVCEVVATLLFLPSTGGTISVTYPFTFAPAP